MMTRVLQFLVAITFLSLASSGGAETVLELSTNPTGMDAWLGEVYLGRTPLGSRIDAGDHLLRISEVSDSLWSAPALDTLLHALEGETLRIALQVGEPYFVTSRPIGVPIHMNGRRLGRTPLHFRCTREDLPRLCLITPAGLVPIPAESLAARGRWTWIGESSWFDEAPSHGGSFWRRLGRYGGPLLGAACALGAKVAENSATRSYDRYLEATDPSSIERYYDETRRRDSLSTGLWIGAEIGLAAAILAWVWPDGDRQKTGTGAAWSEEAPGIDGQDGPGVERGGTIGSPEGNRGGGR